MANIETITQDFGGTIGIDKRQYFNIFAPVGPKMVNRIDDVMVVQAMLNLMIMEPSTVYYSGGTTRTIPPVTGVFNAETARAILDFQRRWSASLLKVDGIVNPGSFQDRTIKIHGHQMTIVYLNQWAELASQAKYGFARHVETLPKLFPQLLAYIALEAFFD